MYFSIRGPAIDEAVSLTGSGTPHGVLGDPLGIRDVALAPTGLLSRGVVASPPYVERLQEEHRRQGRGFELPDNNRPVAGVRRAFNAYPVRGVSEEPDRSVTVLLPLDDATEASPVELLHMGIEAFQEFHSHDQSLSPDSCKGISPSGQAP